MQSYMHELKVKWVSNKSFNEDGNSTAALAQLGERQTEDLKAPCSIHGGGILFIDLIFPHTNICLFKIYVNI